MAEDPGLPFRIDPDLVTDRSRSSEIDALRELALRTKLGGQTPVIISIEDVPEAGSLAYLAQLGTLRNATLQVNLNETIEATSIRFTREQALALAVRLTELLGPSEPYDPADD